MGGRDAWDPGRYERFEDERSRPFHELLELIARRPGMRVLDLGCGTGALTGFLHERLEARATLGLDLSASMLARAPRGVPSLAFVRGSIERAPVRGGFDLVLSNAALHWVDDHAALLLRIREWLATDGQLAVQVPANHHELPHRTAFELAREEPFRSALGAYERDVPVLAPQEYAHLLEHLGYRDARVWLRVYGHRLAGRDEVVEWVRGTLLTDYVKRLPPELGEAFVARYRERLLPRLPDEHPFFFPFQRILFHAFAP